MSFGFISQWGLGGWGVIPWAGEEEASSALSITGATVPTAVTWSNFALISGGLEPVPYQWPMLAIMAQ